MKIIDPIYGKETLTEDVLIEIVNDPSFQRLKGVSQLGLPNKYWIVNGYSRYEHSIGVLIMLRKLGATLHEQISGLIHDISHSAFSHIADWVFRENEVKKAREDYQDDEMMLYLKNFSSIPQILSNHNFNLDRIINTKLFSLLEKPIPDLCADRLDYSLRELYHNNNKTMSKEIWSHVLNVNGEIVITSRKHAKLLAKHFLSMQKNHWGCVEGVRRYHIFASILKNLLNDKTLSKYDFYTKSEIEIFSVINETKYKNNLKTFTKKYKHEPVRNEKVIKKFRYIDPIVFIKNRRDKLSGIDEGYKKSLIRYRNNNDKGIII